MEHFKNFSSLRRKLWILLLCVMFAPVVHSQYDEPAAMNIPRGGNTGGLLCISECETCPVICSPSVQPSPTTIVTPNIPRPSSTQPPALPLLFPPPSPAVHHHHSPPQPYYFPSPTPESSPGTGNIPYNSPPTPVAERSAPPPPSFFSWGGDGGPPFLPTLPPPSFGYMPSIQTPPAGMAQRNYSYPYYYFYTSKASSSFAHLKGSSYAIMLLLLSILVL